MECHIKDIGLDIPSIQDGKFTESRCLFLCIVFSSFSFQVHYLPCKGGTWNGVKCQLY